MKTLKDVLELVNLNPDLEVKFYIKGQDRDYLDDCIAYESRIVSIYITEYVDVTIDPSVKKYLYDEDAFFIGNHNDRFEMEDIFERIFSSEGFDVSDEDKVWDIINSWKWQKIIAVEMAVS